MGSSNNRSNRPAPASTPASQSNEPPSVIQNNDPRGATTDVANHEINRYENQQGPLANAMAYNYGRGSEANVGDYTDIMNQYRSIASGGGSSGGGGGGGGGYSAPSYSAFTVTPERVTADKVGSRALSPLERVKASDPFNSYGGYQEFSQTGGYSPADIANMRSRGVAPIRAAYANAEREVGRQRSLQGGYSPNAVAVQAKMAREQGQSMADASQNVEAGLAQARNQGRLAGLGGMSNIEQARLGAQMQGDIFNSGQAFAGQQFDIGNENQANQFNATNNLNAGQFNANLNYQGQTYNAAANERAQSQNNAAQAAAGAASSAAASQSTADRLAALRGMTSLYGTNPGMSETFGNQALQAVNSGGQFGTNMTNAVGQAQRLPGQFDQTMGRINDISGLASQGAGAVGQVVDAAEERRRRQQQNQPIPSTGTGMGGGDNEMSGYVANNNWTQDDPYDQGWT